MLKHLFVENDRVGGGFWRRGGETPLAVKWEERIIEIREGSWSYIAGSIGKIPGMLDFLTCVIENEAQFIFSSLAFIFCWSNSLDCYCFVGSHCHLVQ